MAAKKKPVYKSALELARDMADEQFAFLKGTRPKTKEEKRGNSSLALEWARQLADQQFAFLQDKPKSDKRKPARARRKKTGKKTGPQA